MDFAILEQKQQPHCCSETIDSIMTSTTKKRSRYRGCQKVSSPCLKFKGDLQTCAIKLIFGGLSEIVYRNVLPNFRTDYMPHSEILVFFLVGLYFPTWIKMHVLNLAFSCFTVNRLLLYTQFSVDTNSGPSKYKADRVTTFRCPKIIAGC